MKNNKGWNIGPQYNNIVQTTEGSGAHRVLFLELLYEKHEVWVHLFFATTACGAT